MNNTEKFKKALELDIAEEVIKASDAYEAVLNDDNAPLDAYLNLANLYFNVLDYGFNFYHKLDIQFIRRADMRMDQVLNEAKKKFPEAPEIQFWLLFFDYILLGKPDFHKECKEIISQKGCSLVPYFYLRCFGNEPAVEYEPQVEALYKKIKHELTIKNRYIISVIESTWGKYRPPNTE